MHKNRVLATLLPDSSKKRLVLLTGARQTGKTTLIKRKYRELRYINFDSPEQREQIRKISSDSWGVDVGNAVIDEAQKEPVVFEKTKYAFDEGLITFGVLTGSSQVLLLKKVRESLAGRISVYELWPLMMGELFSSPSKKAPGEPLINRLLRASRIRDVLGKTPGVLIGKENDSRRKTEEHIAQWGGMPALIHLPGEERLKWLRDYEYTYLERDLSDLARIEDLGPFRKFQKISALRSANLLNYSEIARDTGTCVDTARRYMEYLKLSYQVILLQPFYKNITSSIVKTPKIYWLDVGLLRVLTGFLGEMTGQLYESMVVSELWKWIKTVQSNVEIFFYRTRSGLELDLIIKTPEGIIGAEIKSREIITKTDLRAMKEIAQALGKEWIGGIVIYRGDEIKKIDDPDIWTVPSFRLFTP